MRSFKLTLVYLQTDQLFSMNACSFWMWQSCSILCCRDALTKMKDVYVKNPHMGDPNSVDPRLEEIGQDIDKLELDSRKYEVSWTVTQYLCQCWLDISCLSRGSAANYRLQTKIWVWIPCLTLSSLSFPWSVSLSHSRSLSKIFHEFMCRSSIVESKPFDVCPQAWLLEVETRLAEKSDPHRRQSGLYDSNATTPVNNNCAPVNRER